MDDPSEQLGSSYNQEQTKMERKDNMKNNKRISLVDECINHFDELFELESRLDPRFEVVQNSDGTYTNIRTTPDKWKLQPKFDGNYTWIETGELVIPVKIDGKVCGAKLTKDQEKDYYNGVKINVDDCVIL